MAKIFSFTKSSEPTAWSGFDDFVDNSDLLEFSQPETPQSKEPCPKFTFLSDWTNQELADLYRAHALIQAAQPGLESDRGVSDEGDPWFVIGKSNGDVLVQICRINRTYILDSVSLPHVLSGINFNALVEDFLSTVTENREKKTGPANVVRLSRGGTVCLHPSMMIAALIWTLLQEADELTLPLANGSDAHSGTKALADESAFEDDSPYITSEKDVLFTDHPTDHEEGDALEVDWREPIITSQRDEKQIQSLASGYSHALTTVAIAAGIYSSLEAMDALWKFTQNSDSTPISLEEAEPGEVSSAVTSLELLPKALAFLNSVVDLATFENADSHIAQDETVIETVVEGLDILTEQQIVTAANETFKLLKDASLVKMADVSDETIDALSDNKTQTTIPDGLSESSYTQGMTYNAQAHVSDGSILDIKAIVASFNVDVSSYSTSSFQEGVGKFNGELLKYSELLKSGLTLSEDETVPFLAPTDIDTDPTFSSLNKFDDTVRAFLDDKIENSNLEILLFEREILFVDTASFSGNSISISWQLEDGGRISMIGLSSELSEFLVT